MVLPKLEAQTHRPQSSPLGQKVKTVNASNHALLTFTRNNCTGISECSYIWSFRHLRSKIPAHQSGFRRYRYSFGFSNSALRLAVAFRPYNCLPIIRIFKVIAVHFFTFFVTMKLDPMANVPETARASPMYLSSGMARNNVQ